MRRRRTRALRRRGARRAREPARHGRRIPDASGAGPRFGTQPRRRARPGRRDVRVFVRGGRLRSVSVSARVAIVASGAGRDVRGGTRRPGEVPRGHVRAQAPNRGLQRRRADHAVRPLRQRRARGAGPAPLPRGGVGRRTGGDRNRGGWRRRVRGAFRSARRGAVRVARLQRTRRVAARARLAVRRGGAPRASRFFVVRREAGGYQGARPGRDGGGGGRAARRAHAGARPLRQRHRLEAVADALGGGVRTAGGDV
mmetsp:Transcript_13183/g.55380  ORF Transcript_13183/g.55380 Transcript_13183/m.55380 type:complete len:255 (+) Transcript_13183:2425-3189(+)